MLVLSRKIDETVELPDLEVTIRVLGFSPGRVRLGIAAPAEILVLRGELISSDRQYGHKQQGECMNCFKCGRCALLRPVESLDDDGICADCRRYELRGGSRQDGPLLRAVPATVIREENTP